MLDDLQITENMLSSIPFPVAHYRFIIIFIIISQQIESMDLDSIELYTFKNTR